MQSLEMEQAPKPDESLGKYLQRRRGQLGLTQKEVATQAGIHPQSLGKLERGKTNQLNHKTRKGLTYALQIPLEYLDAICKGIPVEMAKALNFCPQCWTPGTAADSMWLDLRSKFCYACGTRLRHQCVRCAQPITSLKHCFCPYCGTAYKGENLL
jgi:transcriptional regulator with XRE-family HTH domain